MIGIRAIGVLLLTSAIVGCGKGVVDPDIQAIEGVVGNMEAFLESGDPSRVQEFQGLFSRIYQADSNQETLLALQIGLIPRSYDQIQDYVTYLFENYRNINVTFGGLDIRKEGDTARVDTSFSMTATPLRPDLYPSISSTSRVAIFLRMEEGKWRITMWTFLPPS
jgi:hypothetical protein